MEFELETLKQFVAALDNPSPHASDQDKVWSALRVALRAYAQQQIDSMTPQPTPAPAVDPVVEQAEAPKSEAPAAKHHSAKK